MCVKERERDARACARLTVWCGRHIPCTQCMCVCVCVCVCVSVRERERERERIRVCERDSAQESKGKKMTRLV